MPKLNKVSVFRSSPQLPQMEHEKKSDASYSPSISKSRIKRASELPLNNQAYRPAKRVTSCTSIDTVSEPIFKNIKYYTSKKLRSISSSYSLLPSHNNPEVSPKKLQSLVNDMDLSPSTPSRIPGLSYDDTPNSDFSPPTPTAEYFQYNEPEPVARRLFQTDLECSDDDFQLGKLSLDSTATHHIFEIPEIVNRILEIYDAQNSIIPYEQPPVRRVPLSYEHALLIYKDEKKAKQVWKESQKLANPSISDVTAKHALFNCLTVNKLWYHISVDLMQRNCYFDSETKWLKYASSVNKKLKADGMVKFTKPVAETFVLHKLSHVKQRHLDLVMNLTNFKSLKWLELYICPKILPSPRILTHNLKKLVITGSKVLNDEFLINWAPRLPKLEVLDLRACELITDSSIYAISVNCPQLKLLNVGRQTKGELVSDASICSIIKNTQISTLGVAGCGITDRTIWELVINKLSHLERLSLNNCQNLTNESLPRTIHYFKKLSVLEIRHCLQITNVRPLVEFKKSQLAKKISVLVEGCEVIEQLLQLAEIQIDMEISSRILQDIAEWCNSNSDIEE